MGVIYVGSTQRFNHKVSTTRVQPQRFNHKVSARTFTLALGMLGLRHMARSFRDLIVWQLAVELRDRVLPMLQAEPVKRDFKFCDQLADAVRSPPRNIAEGYGRYNPPEISQFIGYARASLDETETHLRDGVTSSYFPAVKVGPLIKLCVRCRKGLESWDTYLRRVRNDPRFSKPPKLRKRTNLRNEPS